MVTGHGLEFACWAPVTRYGRRTIRGALLVHTPSGGPLVLAVQDLLEALVDVTRLSAVVADDELVCLELFRDRGEVRLILRLGVTGPEVASFVVADHEFDRQLVAAWTTAVRTAREWDCRELLYELVNPAGAWYPGCSGALSANREATPRGS